MRVLYNLGCGPRDATPAPPYFSDWREVRVDVDPAAAPDIVADLVDLSPIVDGAADAVWASHCLEHLHAHEVGTALREIRRILRPTGVAILCVPDLQAVAGEIARDRLGEALYTAPSGPVTAHDVVYGHGPMIAAGASHMAHKCGFTPAVLTDRLKAASFASFGVFRREGFELCAIAVRRPWRDAEEGRSLFRALRL